MSELDKKNARKKDSISKINDLIVEKFGWWGQLFFLNKFRIMESEHWKNSDKVSRHTSMIIDPSLIMPLKILLCGRLHTRFNSAHCCLIA